MKIAILKTAIEKKDIAIDADGDIVLFVPYKTPQSTGCRFIEYDLDELTKEQIEEAAEIYMNHLEKQKRI